MLNSIQKAGGFPFDASTSHHCLCGQREMEDTYNLTIALLKTVLSSSARHSPLTSGIPFLQELYSHAHSGWETRFCLGDMMSM